MRRQNLEKIVASHFSYWPVLSVEAALLFPMPQASLCLRKQPCGALLTGSSYEQNRSLDNN